MHKNKNIKERNPQNVEANTLLRVITLIAGIFTILLISLLKIFYPQYTSYMLITGIPFAAIYFLIFIATFISDFVKGQALNILYFIYYISSIAMLFSLYQNSTQESYVKILLLVTFAVVLGIKKMSYLIVYIILMFISIVIIFTSSNNNLGDSLIDITLFAMFFLLAYVNLRSKLVTEKALIDAEESIKEMAYYDAVTGLPNRYKLNSSMNQLITEINGEDKTFAVVFIDLDNFKNINDSLGHGFGDSTLVEASKILASCVRNNDIVSRYAGDEFVLILKDISEEESVLIVNRIINEFKKPILIEEHEIYTTTSVGISLYPSDGNTVDTLIKNADAAMYKAKYSGKSKFCLYSEEFNKSIRRRMELENGLRKALENGELFLAYQPQVKLESGELWGIEALIRWNHPKLGIVSPLEFIPIAEETSLIVPIGEWVIQTACKQNKQWQEEGLDIVPIAINVSAVQLKQSNFVETMKKCLEDYKLDSKYIVVELTESIMQDMKIAFEVVNNLKALGIRVAIDDFGTGYSSLSLLKNIDIDILKIDSYFIQDIANNKNTLSIINFICEMGDSLKFSTIIEGIESLEQSEIIEKSGCKLGQGYLFSKPVIAEEVKEYIQYKK